MEYILRDIDIELWSKAKATLERKTMCEVIFESLKSHLILSQNHDFAFLSVCAHDTRPSRSSPIFLFVFSSVSPPSLSNLSAANGTITSGWLSGYMFRKTQLWRRCYWALAVPSIPTDAPMMATGFPSNALSP